MRRITLMTFCLICTFVAGCVDGSTPAPTAMPPTSPPQQRSPTQAAHHPLVARCFPRRSPPT